MDASSSSSRAPATSASNSVRLLPERGEKLANRQYEKDDLYTMNVDGSAVANVTNSRYVGEEDCVRPPSANQLAYRKAFFEKADGSGRPKTVRDDPT